MTCYQLDGQTEPVSQLLQLKVVPIAAAAVEEVQDSPPSEACLFCFGSLDSVFLSLAARVRTGLVVAAAVVVVELVPSFSLAASE